MFVWEVNKKLREGATVFALIDGLEREVAQARSGGGAMQVRVEGESRWKTVGGSAIRVVEPKHEEVTK
jgi:hypothetical protein